MRKYYFPNLWTGKPNFRELICFNDATWLSHSSFIQTQVLIPKRWLFPSTLNLIPIKMLLFKRILSPCSRCKKQTEFYALTCYCYRIVQLCIMNRVSRMKVLLLSLKNVSYLQLYMSNETSRYTCLHVCVKICSRTFPVVHNISSADEQIWL